MLLLEDIGLTPAELSYSLHKIQSSQTITFSCEVIQHAIHPSRLPSSTSKRGLAEPIDYKHNSKRRRNTIPTPASKRSSLQLRRQSSKPSLLLPQYKDQSNHSNPSNHPSPSDLASPTEVVVYKDDKLKQSNLTKPKEPKLRLRYGFSFQQLEEMQAIFRDQPRISDSFKNDLATKFKTFPECIDSWFSFNRQQVRWQRWQEQEKMRLAKAEEKRIRDLVILQKKLEDLRVLIREAAE